MSFADRVTEDIYSGNKTKAARKRLPLELWETAQARLQALFLAETIESLFFPPSNRFERLKGIRKDEYSIRINRTYRICFRWHPEEGAYDLLIEDYHS